MIPSTSISRWSRRLLSGGAAATVLVAAAFASLTPVATQAQAEVADTTPRMTWDPNDPRIGLKAGWGDAGQAISNMEHLAFIPRPQGFFNPEQPTDGRFNNTDLAFRGNLLFQGNYNGFQVYDISDPTFPDLRV